MAEPGPEPKVLLGDKGYDADAILADLEDRGTAAIIPPKRNRTIPRHIDGHLYALRNLVERCCLKLKHSRRLATRYDKTAGSYRGFVLVASIRLWLRHFVNKTQVLLRLIKDICAAAVQHHGARLLPEWKAHSYTAVSPPAF